MRYPLAFIFSIVGVYGCDNSAPTTSYHVDTLEAQQVTFTDSITSFPDTALLSRIAQEKLIANVSGELRQIKKELQKTGQQSVFYTVPGEKVSKISGPRGLIVTVNPSDLETVKGKPIFGPIEIELKEALTQTHFLQNNINTVSNGRLLVSGGAYYVNMTADGEQLKIKEGRSVKMQLPRITDSSMSLFYAEKTASGDVNWRETTEKFMTAGSKKQSVDTTGFYLSDYEGQVTRMDVSEFKQLKGILRDCDGYYTATETEAPKVYDEMDIRGFGWINCDRFLGETNLVALNYYFSDNDSIQAARMFLAFKNINSVMSHDFRAYNRQNSFPNIPSGAQAVIIAVGLKNGALVADKMDVTAWPGQSVTLSMRPLKEAEIPQLFSLK
jgi:hypothetical protein